MTWARWARIAPCAAVFVFLGWHGAAAVFAGVWVVAAAFYALALIFAAAIYAEWSTAAAYADAVDAGLSTRPTSRAHARLLARRVLRGICRCDRWWTSFGTDHDPMCPVQTGAPRRAHHPRARRPVPRRRAVAPARRHRRHRSR